MAENKVNLKIMTLAQLEELRDRQLFILKNRLILDKLADKGERAKHLLEKIKQELDHRKTEQELESQMKSLDINKTICSESESKPKYVEHICKIEKNVTDERFKPFRTPKIMEISKPSQLIELRESVDLQSKQAIRVQEESVKQRYREKVEESEEDGTTDESSGNESSDTEANDDGNG